MTVSEAPERVVVAAAQLGPASATRAATVERIVEMIGEAKRRGVALLVFPELALSPYFASEIREDIAPFVETSFPSDETMPIIDAVKAAGIVTVVPFAEMVGETLYNSSAVIDSDGTILGHYRKNHIPGQVEPDPDGGFSILEKRYFAPGDLGFPVYPSPAGGLGVAICYDRRFPETYRSYAMQDAGVIACCFNTPVVESMGATIESSQEAQELATRGGAISNGTPVIAAGKAGVELGQRYSGGSCVIDHTGTILAKATTDGDELVVAELDLAAAAGMRSRLDLGVNRRPDIYVTDVMAAV
jgi:predicted amidohydrolase